MKNILRFSALLIIIVLILSACNGSKYAGASHNHGVSNRGYSGY